MQHQKKLFRQNVLPSMAAFAFSGLYTIVDGFFVGRNIGDPGLAAINIAYPVTAFIQAIGTGTGMAGAIRIAISNGEDNEDGKNHYLGNTLSLLLLCSVVVTALLSFIYMPLLKLLGAEGAVLTHAAAYLKIIILGSIFQLCAVGLLPLIRNYSGALTAMVAMIAGFVTNILLDWYFTSALQLGTAGAAAATIIGQAVSLVPCLIFILHRWSIFRKAKLMLRAGYVKTIAMTALSPFGAVLSPMLILIVINKTALIYGGNSEVACFAVVSYVVSVVYQLTQGIGDGVQPLIGKSYGAQDTKSLHLLQRMAFSLSMATAVICMVLLFLTRTAVPHLFGASETVSALYRSVVLYFLIGLPFTAISKVAGSYFYATGQSRAAYSLIYSEPIAMLVCAGFIFPRFLGVTGVWVSVPFTQFLLAVFSIVMLAVVSRSLKRGG